MVSTLQWASCGAEAMNPSLVKLLLQGLLRLLLAVLLQGVDKNDFDDSHKLLSSYDFIVGK